MAACATAWAGGSGLDLDSGIRERNQGNISESVRLLERAAANASGADQRLQATTQLALSLVQAGRLADAERILKTVQSASNGAENAAITLALGNVAMAEHDPRRAGDLYRTALAAAQPSGNDVGVFAQLNLARLQPAPQKLETLERLYSEVAALVDPGTRAQGFFSLGIQAAAAVDLRLAPLEPPSAPGAAAADAPALDAPASGATTAEAPESGAPAGAPAADVNKARSDWMLQVAYNSLRQASDLAQATGDAFLRVEVADAVAQLYESQDRFAEAMQLNRIALALADHMDLGQVEALLVRLEWRAARLQQRLGDDSSALASYLRASRHLEAIRHDLPIDDEAGASTYQTLLKPIFTNLLDLMLRDVDRTEDGGQPKRLGSVMDALELTHQAEMQDYLGDRCSVESIKQRADAPLDAGVAVLYTIVLHDRLEVVVRTNAGVTHHAVPIAASELETQIGQFRRELADTGSTRYLPTAQRFYRWFIGPFESQLKRWGVHELVIVPDGYLRLIPFAALHDGRQFVAERYSVSTVTGLTMTESGGGRESQTLSLLAGLSSPGPVVNTLIAMGFLDATASGRAAARRALARTPAEGAHAPAESAGESALRAELALPGVKTEIDELSALGRAKPLMNDQFTVARFEQEVATGRYRMIHVASHGFFGNSAQDSFLLAFDNVIRMDDLQRVIADNGNHGGAIDLLTLSACETAEGNDRAPLGFAGAAIRARARSVVGTLWPVNDAAASRFMEVFYLGMQQHAKAEAFAAAQRSLIGTPEFAHPYFWAPITLIGNWN